MLDKTKKTLDLQRQVIALFQKELNSMGPQTPEVPEIFILLDKLYQESIVEIESLASVNNEVNFVDDKSSTKK